MFDEEFCGRLEYAISAALSRSADLDYRRCWCDGVLLPENEEERSLEQIIKTKQLLTTSWIDEGRTKGRQRGQFLYQMRLKFGAEAIDRFKVGERMEDCIPTTNADAWIALDREKQTIEVQLV